MPDPSPTLRAALYARVSSDHQTTDNQLRELREYAQRRGWSAVEYIDQGVSGAKDRRPGLDRLMADAKRRKVDVVVSWKLDRLGRNLKHLITLLDEFHALGMAFVSLGEGIDATTPAGKLQMHILGAIAEFERGRIVERVRAGLARARAQGTTLGRRRCTISDARFAAVAHLSVREAALAIGTSRSVVHRWRLLSQKPSHASGGFASESRIKSLASPSGHRPAIG
jgi:DNA invertase Pin-like site-specific DNA recombinase